MLLGRVYADGAVLQLQAKLPRRKDGVWEVLCVSSIENERIGVEETAM